LEGVVTSACPNDYAEDWDLDALVLEARQYYPTRFATDELRKAARADEIYESLLAEALGYYEQREQQFGPDVMRQIERQIMLQIIDTRWREHLSEMDYLYEGINLRAMGQQDPEVAWKHEGFEMFGQMMAAIDDDFVKYVMHIEVELDTPEAPDLSQAQYVAPEDPVQGSGNIQRALAAEAAANPEEYQPQQQQQGYQQPPPGDEVPNIPVVRSEWEKTSRNAPCPCGSGKKYKLCHGA
jgi:preprotein translocase subunit SecA